LFAKRWHVHFTPTSASWINQVERFFGLLADELRFGEPRGVDELIVEIAQFPLDVRLRYDQRFVGDRVSAPVSRLVWRRTIAAPMSTLTLPIASCAIDVSPPLLGQA
jgi:hypothetical protein